MSESAIVTPEQAPPASDQLTRKPRKKRLTAEQLPREAERQMRDSSYEVLTSFWESVKVGLKARDPKVMALVADMYSYRKAAGGVSIMQNNITQNNGSGNGETRVRSFEAIVAKLETKDEIERGPIAQPDEIDDILEGDPDDAGSE